MTKLKSQAEGLILLLITEVESEKAITLQFRTGVLAIHKNLSSGGLASVLYLLVLARDERGHSRPEQELFLYIHRLFRSGEQGLGDRPAH